MKTYIVSGINRFCLSLVNSNLATNANERCDLEVRCIRFGNGEPKFDFQPGQDNICFDLHSTKYI